MNNILKKFYNKIINKFKYNVYWDISGGYIFHLLDISAHKEAEIIIWHSVTASANIQYFNWLKNIDNIKVINNIVKINERKINIVSEMYEFDKIISIANFLFIKK